MNQNSMICLESIIKKMAESSKFDPIILLIPSRYSEHEEYLYRVKENNFKELKIPIFIYDDLIKINSFFSICGFHSRNSSFIFDFSI